MLMSHRLGVNMCILLTTKQMCFYVVVFLWYLHTLFVCDHAYGSAFCDYLHTLTLLNHQLYQFENYKKTNKTTHMPGLAIEALR